jgi:hypothetical protein
VDGHAGPGGDTAATTFYEQLIDYNQKCVLKGAIVGYLLDLLSLQIIFIEAGEDIGNVEYAAGPNSDIRLRFFTTRSKSPDLIPITTG